jgi:hypothetical protein
MAPVLVLRPAGRPTAEIRSVPPESVALMASDPVSPWLLVWSTGAVSATGLLTFQVKVCVAE